MKYKKFDFDKFLEAYHRNYCNVDNTCKELNMSKSTYYAHLGKNPINKKKIDASRAERVNNLMSIAIEKAETEKDLASIQMLLGHIVKSQNVTLSEDRLKQDALNFKKRLEFDTMTHKDNLEYKRERDKQLLEAELPYVNIKADDFRKIMRDRGVEIPDNVDDV